jgi:regulator of protease activity HflC (stomatin/prohibitin superfamily)
MMTDTRRSSQGNQLPPLPNHPFAGHGPALGYMIGWMLVVAILIFFAPAWVWFYWRIEPGSNELAVLIRKTGNDLPSGQILALEPGQKGIQLEILQPGRYFRNPYTWGWEIHAITDIPAGKLGVRTRLYGDDPVPGGIIATDDSKGIVRDVLRPGKYLINPYAYSVAQYDAVAIRPGSVGVVTSLTGKDVLKDGLPAELRNDYLVAPELKGVLAQVLDPGTYYLNPYMLNVVEVNLQSQRFAMSGDDAISFLTSDGFTITVEGTIEYALLRDKAAMLTHKVGDMDDILKKVVLPHARGFSRIAGSKNPAKNFITGDTRQVFQDTLQGHLRAVCKDKGIDVRSVLVRNITPPDEVASIIRAREVAAQMAKRYEQEIEQARSKAELTRQEMLAEQSKQKVESETAKIRAEIKARQDQSVLLTGANRELDVARLQNEAAVAQVEAKLLGAGAQQQVIRMQNEAEAAVLANRVEAFGNGMNVARYTFYERIGPRISSILSSDDPRGLGGLFLPYVPSGKEVQQ